MSLIGVAKTVVPSTGQSTPSTLQSDGAEVSRRAAGDPFLASQRTTKTRNMTLNETIADIFKGVAKGYQKSLR